LILLIIVGFTTVVVIDDKGIELEPTHYCESIGIKMYCARTTEMYCYPKLDTRFIDLLDEESKFYRKLNVIFKKMEASFLKREYSTYIKEDEIVGEKLVDDEVRLMVENVNDGSDVLITDANLVLSRLGS